MRRSASLLRRDETAGSTGVKSWGFKGEVTTPVEPPLAEDSKMQCRKCGSKKTTRRRAGVFSCAHCGVQPGPFLMDRFGNPGPIAETPADPAPTDYIIKPRQPRLAAGVHI
jgi:hypothetical protein